jgi:hypothetical protein
MDGVWLLDFEHELISFAHHNQDNMHKYILMQFTGLLDKNGKEIYEGDVVFDCCQSPGLSGNRQVKWYQSGCKFNLDNVLGHSLSGGCEKYLEVIGNVHENPELVKE